MKFPKKLEAVKIIRRYKRFLADVIHPKKGELTVHCPNTGSMKNCWQEGWTVWLLDSNNPKRKYAYTWILTEDPRGDFIGINSSFANDIVYEAIIEGKIKELLEFDEIQREVKYGDENSRIDILLSKANQKIFIEIKSVTLLDETAQNKERAQGQGYFPDAVTTRGQKHIRELICCVKNGHRAVLFFLVQHTGIKKFSIAQHIDPDYAALIQLALKSGVEVLVYNTNISQFEITLNKKIPFIVKNDNNLNLRE